MGRIGKFALFAATLALTGWHAAWGGTITGSAHDFTSAGWSNGRICIACHAAHNNDTTVVGAPLWNHANSTITSYTLYSSPTFDGATTIGQPAASSKLCLSCHDGSVAVDSFGTMTGTTFVTTEIGKNGNLQGDHPIGFTYDSAMHTNDSSLADPATEDVTIGTAPQSKTGKIGTLLLYDGKMECASCHDAHNTFTAQAPPGQVDDNGNPKNNLIKISEVGSAICLACHKK